MLSDEVIQRFKEKIPKLKGDDKYHGILQLDIKLTDKSTKQIVLLFERLRVEEPTEFLRGSRIYADTLVKIHDEVLIDIASKVISIDEAVDRKLFRVYGDGEVWKRQFAALKRILPMEHFAPRPKEPEPEPEPPIDYASLPQMDLTKIPVEFKALTEHFASLRDKYQTKKVEPQPPTKK